MLMCLVENMDKIEGDISVDQLKEEKELARRLAMLLGLDGQKNRLAVVLIHKEGIQIALGQERDRCKLMLVLAEFSGKLLKQDRQLMVEFLNREVVRCQRKEQEEVVIYRNALLGVERGVAGEDDKEELQVAATLCNFSYFLNLL
jgi:hypothetical protein